MKQNSKIVDYQQRKKQTLEERQKDIPVCTHIYINKGKLYKHELHVYDIIFNLGQLKIFIWHNFGSSVEKV